MVAQAWWSASALGGQTAMWAAAAAGVLAKLCATPVVGAALQRLSQPSYTSREHRTLPGRSFSDGQHSAIASIQPGLLGNCV